MSQTMLKASEVRTSRAHIEAIFAERGLIRAKVPEQPGTKFITDDAFRALITVRHKREAVNALVLGQLQLLDPTIGDASCEMRAPLVLDMLDSVRAILHDGDEEIVRAYIAAHAQDKVDTQVRTVADALGCNTSAHDGAAYDALVQRVEAALGAESMDLATLCLTFTKSSVWTEDEFGYLFSFRSKAPMAVAGEAARISGNKADLIQVEQYLRSALAFNAVAAFERKIAEIPRYEISPGLIPDAGKQFFIENQLSAASAAMRSKIPFTFTSAGHAEQHELPLLPIFNQILAILYMLFNQRRGILVRVRRHEMKPIKGDSTKQRYAETFAGAYVLLWTPNPQTGLFDVVDEPTAEHMDCNFVAFDAWSKYIAGTTGTGLDAADLNQHREALKSSNIIWLLLQFAATHPDYTRHAVDKDINYVAGYDAICVPQPDGVTFKPTREQFAQLHLKMHLPNESPRPNLLNLWTLATAEGEKRALHDNCQAITGPSVRDLYERINRAVDFQVDHIFAAPFTWLVAHTHALIAKHAAAPNAVFGPHVVRIGDGCVSFLDIKGAHTVLMLKKDHQRKVKCKEILPANAAFIKS